MLKSYGLLGKGNPTISVGKKTKKNDFISGKSFEEDGKFTIPLGILFSVLVKTLFFFIIHSS